MKCAFKKYLKHNNWLIHYSLFFKFILNNIITFIEIKMFLSNSYQKYVTVQKSNLYYVLHNIT